MADLIVKEAIWKEIVEIAKRRRKKPEELANVALREFLQREADEELLRQSNRAAQKTRFPISETEEIIRQHRKRNTK